MKISKRQLKQIIQEEVYGDHPSSYRPGESPLTDLAAGIEDAMQNAVGQIDLDYSDDPLTYKDILDFVVRMLHEQRQEA